MPSQVPGCRWRGPRQGNQAAEPSTPQEAWPSLAPQVMTVARRAPGPASQAQLLGLLWIVLGGRVSELIRFLRFQCSPNPVSRL